MTMTADALDQNRAAASAFITKLTNLNRQWYGQIHAPDIDAAPFASARLKINALRTLAGSGPSKRMGEFVVPAYHQISQLHLPPAVEHFARAVALAILVRNLDGGEQALQALYQPFEAFIPLASLTTAPTEERTGKPY